MAASSTIRLRLIAFNERATMQSLLEKELELMVAKRAKAKATRAIRRAEEANA